MVETKATQQTELEITTPEGREPIVMKGELASLHDNPEKIHQLLDLLELPKGTQVRVITRAASVIVR